MPELPEPRLMDLPHSPVPREALGANGHQTPGEVLERLFRAGWVEILLGFSKKLILPSSLVSSAAGDRAKTPLDDCSQGVQCQAS